MKKAFLLGAMVCVLGMMTACRNTNNPEAEEDTAHFADTIQPPDTVDEDTTVEVTQNDDSFLLPTHFDFIPREEYHLLIKGALRYDKKNGISLDSAIREYYDDDIMPVDSIKKWWSDIRI